MVAAQMVGIATTNDSVDLTSTATVTAVLSDTVEAVEPISMVDVEDIGVFAVSVAVMNKLVNEVDPTGEGAADIASAAQGELQTSVENLAEGTTDPEGFSEAADPNDLLNLEHVSTDKVEEAQN